MGILRNRGDCLNRDFDLWVGGYPRSANSFATAAIRLGNPKLRVATHWHIPAFIISAIRSSKPGLLLVRKPVDAVVSWTIFWEGRMHISDALDYYLDFHRALLPYREQLFVATFEETVENFERVLHRFNKSFNTNYSLLQSNDSVNRCIGYMEDWFRGPDGSVNEFRVPRPSKHRAELKGRLTKVLRDSSQLSKRLSHADEIYQHFSKIHHDVGCLPPVVAVQSSGL